MGFKNRLQKYKKNKYKRMIIFCGLIRVIRVFLVFLHRKKKIQHE